MKRRMGRFVSFIVAMAMMMSLLYVPSISAEGGGWTNIYTENFDDSEVWNFNNDMTTANTQIGNIYLGEIGAKEPISTLAESDLPAGLLKDASASPGGNVFAYLGRGSGMTKYGEYRPIVLYDKSKHGLEEAPAALRVAYDLASYDDHSLYKIASKFGLEYTVNVDETSTTYRPVVVYQEKGDATDVRQPNIGDTAPLYYFMPNTGKETTGFSNVRWTIGKWNHVEMVFDFVNRTTEIYFNNIKIGVQQAPQITYDQLENIVTYGQAREDKQDSILYYDNITVDQVPAGGTIPSIMKADLTVVPEGVDLQTGTEMTLTTAVTDSQEREITRVEYFANDVSIGTATNAEEQFKFTWSLPQGEQNIKAVATNSNGDTVSSSVWQTTGWDEVYSVQMGEIAHGTLTASATENVVNGNEITVTAVPDTGYRLEQMSYMPASGSEPVVLAAADNVASFTMPADNIILNAVFVKIDYAVFTNAVSNGTVKYSINNGPETETLTTAQMDDTIRIISAADEGFEVSAVSVYQKDQMIDLQDNTFTMPAGDVMITVVIKDPNANEVEYLKLNFEDLTGVDTKTLDIPVYTVNQATGKLADVGAQRVSSSSGEIGKTFVVVKDEEGNRYFACANKDNLKSKILLDEPIAATGKLYFDFRVKNIWAARFNVPFVGLDENGKQVQLCNLYHESKANMYVNGVYNSAGSTFAAQTELFGANNDTDWHYMRFVLDFDTESFSVYTGDSFENLQDFAVNADGVNSFDFMNKGTTKAVQFAGISSYSFGENRSQRGFDDVRVYAVKNAVYSTVVKSNDKTLGTVTADRNLVSAGEIIKVTTAAATGNRIKTISVVNAVTGVDVSETVGLVKVSGVADQYTYTMPAYDVRVEGVFEVTPVRAIAFANGAEDAVGDAPVWGAQPEGSTITLPLNPFTRDGYSFEGWSDGENVFAEGAEYIVPAQDVTFTAVWSAISGVKNITVSSMENGTVIITPEGSAQSPNTEITLTAQPEPGYELKSITVLDAQQGEVLLTGSATDPNVWTFVMPNRDVTVSAVFALKQYSIKTLIKGEGTITVAENKTTAVAGEAVSFTVAPGVGRKIQTVGVSSETGAAEVTEADGSYNFTMPIGDVQIAAYFADEAYNVSDYLNLDFEDAVKGNQKIITTDWSTANLYTVESNANLANRGGIGEDSTKYIQSNAKGQVLFRFFMDPVAVNTEENKLYIDFRHKRKSLTDDGIQLAFRDGSKTPKNLFVLSIPGGGVPTLVIGGTNYPAEYKDLNWHCYRAVIDFTAGKMQFLVGDDFDHLAPWSAEYSEYTLPDGVTHIKEITNAPLTKGGNVFDDIHVYTKLNPSEPTATPEPTATATPEPTATATPEPTATATPEPTATATPEPTATATPEPTATATPEPTATATPEPTATATPEPTATATPEPTATATPEPTATDAPSVPTATATSELPAVPSEVIVKSVSGGSDEFTATGKWEVSNVKHEDGTSSLMCKDTLTGDETSSAKFKPANLVPGEYVVWFYMPYNGFSDTNATVRIANENPTGGFTTYQNDFSFDQVNNASLTEKWVRITGKPINFKGDGNDYVEILRTSQSGSEYTRVGWVKFVPVVYQDEYMVENPQTAPQTSAYKPLYPSVDFTGTWGKSTAVKLGYKTTDNATLYSVTKDSTARFYDNYVKPGSTRRIWLYTPYTSGQSNDTMVSVTIHHNGITEEPIIFDQMKTENRNQWVELTVKPLIFAGDGSDYVEIKRTNEDTATSTATRIGAVRFVSPEKEISANKILQASEDTFVHGGGAAVNHGSETTMLVKSTSAIGMNNYRKGLVKFDLSTINEKVTKVSLNLTGKRSNEANVTLGVYALSNDWEENVVTWSNVPTLDAETSQKIGEYEVTVNADRDFTIDVTDYVLSKLNSGEKTVSFGLLGINGADGKEVTITLHSRENTSGRGPCLDIEYLTGGEIPGPQPTATATATAEPTATATPEPTATATPEPTVTATPEPTATATPEPTATATPEPTATATPEPTATAVPKYEVESAPVSHGRVEVSPSGQQQSGQEVTIAAVADTGYEVKGISVTKKDNAQISVPVQDNKFIMPEYAVTVNVTIAPTVYAIHYDLAQGSVENANPENYTIESDEIVLNNPTRGGYSFAGWTGTALDSPTMRVVIAQGSTGERSYTATWTRILTPLTGVSISGAALVGQRLAAVLTPDGAEAAYQWYRGDQPIDNAVEASYTVTNDDIGSTIKVTATGSGNYTGAVTSDATAAVPKLAGQVSVTTADTSKAYDGNAFAVEGTSSTGQTVKVSYAVKDGETLETAPVNAGTYVATIKAEENAVYTEAVAVHEFTILQKELTITWPDVLEFMQDGSEKRVTPEITGFVGEDSAANIITVANDKATAVGDYTAAVTLQNADGNYKLPANSSQDWKITAKPTYVVTLTQGTGYTLAAKDGAGTTVEQGGNFSFTLALDAAYNKSVPVVKVNDVPLEAVQGVYTIADIGEAKTVTVDGVTLNSYTVTFKVDGNVYGEVQTVSHGANAETPVPPTKDATASTVYTFNSWDKALTNITADVEINAVFDETVRKYTVKFVSEGQELQSTEVEYGTLPVYAGATPQKSATAEYTFTFDKWTPDVAEVTGEATYTAVFTQQAREYNIQYYVDNELKYTDTFAYGAAVTARNPESREGYTFSGWSTIPEIMPAENVRVDGSFAVNSYDVTVSAENGSVNFTEGVAENKANYGTTVKFTVTPNENYVVQEVKYNGTLLTAEAGVYSFTMPAENVAITCVFAEDPDYILVRNAVAAISEMQFAASSEEAANAETALAKVKALLGTIENVSLQVNAGSFNAAVDGTHSAPAGTAGSYTFTVTAQAGQKSMTSETLNMVISPKVYADSENAEINGITVSGVPAVGAETSYTVMLPYGTEVTAEDIAVSLVDAKASVTGKTAEGNVWTIIVTAESGAEKRYTLTVNYSANPDIAIVEGVVNAVNALAFEAVTNPTSQTAIEEMITGKLNGVKGETNVSVTEGVYTAAVDGTVENHAGTSGSYIFKVAVTKGEVSRTSNQLTVTIQPVAYTAIPLAVPENLRWTESSASWDAVANAAGYQVQLYKDGSPAGAAVSVTGSEVYDFAEMITETGSYTFTVKAVSANQEDYTDSAVSAQSAAYDFVQTYTVTVNKTGEGTVSITPEGKVEAGRQMTVTATPAAGQRLVAIEVSGGTVVSMDGNVGTFTMPAEDVTVSVLFAEIENIFINFSVDGQEYGNINGKPGTRITAEQIPADPVKDGFVFLGWYLEDTKYIFDVIPETDIQLEAKFAEINNDAVRTIVEAKAEDLLNPESKAAILSALEVVAANGSESDKAAVANISADVAKAIAEAVGATTEFVYTETSADEIQIPTIANMTGKGSDSYRVEIEKLNLFEHENLADKNTAVYDVSVFINEVKTSASLLPQIVNLVVDNNIDLRTVKAFSVDDAGVWEDLPILGMQGNIITVKTSHFSKIGVYSDPVEDPDTQGTTAEIQLEKVDDGLYNIVLTPTGTPNQITRFASAEFTLNNTVTTGDVGMEVNAGADLKMSENGTSDNNGTVSTKYLIYVDVDGGKAPITKAEGERLIVGNVRLTGVGEGTLNITEAQGYTKSKTDALVKNLTLTPGADAPYTLTEATNPFKLTISFNNKVELTNAAYTDMKVRVSGSNGKVEEIALGDGEPGVTSEIEGRTSRYIVDLNLVAGVRYSVTISGAGYRNYTKSFTMPENEGVNMHVWNNVMDMPASVITGESDGDTTVTFLAGDIVKDGKINIYDLSAVVSYFGEVELDNEETSALAKYDLNRDGKIDSKDVAMVLVSWNN